MDWTVRCVHNSVETAGFEHTELDLSAGAGARRSQRLAVSVVASRSFQRGESEMQTGIPIPVGERRLRQCVKVEQIQSGEASNFLGCWDAANIDELLRLVSRGLGMFDSLRD